MVAQEEESGYWQSQPDPPSGDGDDKLVVYRQNDITIASIEVLVCSFILICSFNLCSSAGREWSDNTLRSERWTGISKCIKLHQPTYCTNDKAQLIKAKHTGQIREKQGRSIQRGEGCTLQRLPAIAHISPGDAAESEDIKTGLRVPGHQTALSSLSHLRSVPPSSLISPEGA